MKLFIEPYDRTYRTLFKDFAAESENVSRDSYSTYLLISAEADINKGNASLSSLT